MNLYLSALGFSKVKTRKQIAELIESVTSNPDKRYVLGRNSADMYFEFFKEFGDDFGLVARGEMNDRENPVVHSCYVYAYSKLCLPCNNLDIVCESNEYTVGYCDDSNGNEFIFRLQNIADYKSTEKKPVSGNINFVGLSVKAAVVLPTAKEEGGRILKLNENPLLSELGSFPENTDMALENANAISLDAGNPDGAKEPNAGIAERDVSDVDEEAILECLRNSIFEDDVLTIVDAYIIPEPSCVTLYSILAEIKKVETLLNYSTNEQIYRLLLDVEGTAFEVLINYADITGFPMVGMRFMGYCYMQGRVFF